MKEILRTNNLVVLNWATVVLKDAANRGAALEFLAYLKGSEAQMIMIRFGFLIPEN